MLFEIENFLEYTNHKKYKSYPKKSIRKCPDFPVEHRLATADMNNTQKNQLYTSKSKVDVNKKQKKTLTTNNAVIVSGNLYKGEELKCNFAANEEPLCPLISPLKRTSNPRFPRTSQD